MKQATTHYTFAADRADAERKHREGKSWHGLGGATSAFYSNVVAYLPTAGCRLFAIRTVRKALCPGWYVWTKGPIPVGARVGFDGSATKDVVEPKHLQLWCSSALRNDFIPLTWEEVQGLTTIFPLVYLNTELLKRLNLGNSAIKVVELK